MYSKIDNDYFGGLLCKINQLNGMDKKGKQAFYTLIQTDYG